MKNAFLSFIALIAIAFLVIAIGRFVPVDEASYEEFWPRRIWLWFHIAGGTVAMLIGIFNLWSGLNNKKIKAHRITGRIYLLAVLVGSIAGFGLAATTTRGMVFSAGLTGLGLAWVLTTSMAWIAILNKQIQQHKEWMIRSYVVTFGFVFFRFYLIISIVWEIGTFEEKFQMASWLCWTIPLLLTEVLLQRREVIGSLPVNR